VRAGRHLSALAGGAARRPRLVVGIALVLGVVAGVLALGLRSTAATDTFVSSSSSSYRDTQRFYRSFGEEPIEVLVKGDLQQLLLSSDVVRLVGLEGCLSGNVPASALATVGGTSGPCGQLARAGTVKVVLGPGTFINEAANQIDEQLTAETRQAQAQAAAAQAAVQRTALTRGLSAAQAATLGQQASRITIARFQEGLVKLALQYGLTSRPSLEDANFVSTLVFDSSKPAGTPKQRFAYVFPNRDTALISVRMRPGLSEGQRTHTIALVRQAVAMPQWQLTRGGSYVVTGVPVLVADLPAAISHSIELLMIAVLLVMAATLGLIFTGSPRLLPLGLAVLATALTFGALAVSGASLTMASIAVLPVLVGLAVDYAIQFQSRVGEAFEQLGEPAEASEAQRARLVVQAAGAGSATIATAGAASAAAMLGLLLSPVPMVRGFGVLLLVGVAIALGCALVVGAAALTLAPAVPRARVRVPAGLQASWRGARELLADNPLTRAVSNAALVGAVGRPGRVLCVGLALAALGWGLDGQTRVQTEITKLVPQNLSSLQGLEQLEHRTGVAGEIDLMVSGANVTSPSTIGWMSSYESAILSRFGYSAARGCGQARLCPAFSLPDLFGGQAAAGGSRAKLSTGEVNALLHAIPAYFSQSVITADRRVATLAFGIRVMSLQQQQQLIEGMRSSLHPPVGVSARLVGLPVLAAQSGSQVSDPWRRLLTLLVGLAAVAVVLLLAFAGDLRRALVPLVPIVLATGWSALILFLVRVPLNPMSVTLGVLVIAISTEFSVLLAERHRQERLAGYDTIEALHRTYRRTGTAVAASGTTAIAGFGVLVLSEIAMLRDFGLVTLIDLSVSLVGVLVALPAALVIAEREDPLRIGRQSGASAGALARGRPASVLRRGRRAPGAGSGHETA